MFYNKEVEKIEVVIPVAETEIIESSEVSSISNVERNINTDAYKKDVDHSKYLQDLFNQYQG